MKKTTSFSCLLFASALAFHTAMAQPTADDTLHVIKSSVNADSDNAELCLEFDKPLATTPARLTNNLHLEKDGKAVVPQNIVPTASSLCLFPLDRGQPYSLALSGMRGAQNEKMTTPYMLSFTIPDRSPLLAFTGANGGVNGFGSYESPLSLRAVNVAHAKLEIYHITDTTAMAHIWQDRAQTVLAPSESAYLARTKGQLAWSRADTFNAERNATFEQKISLHDVLPNLAPGLYLIIADAGDGEELANKGLAPLAAAWFTKSDFALRAVRDSDGVHAFAATLTGPKTNLHLAGLNRALDQIADVQSGTDGTGTLQKNANDISTVIASDKDGNIAFADIDTLPVLAGLPALGAITSDDPFAAPARNVDLTLSLAAIDSNAAMPSFVRIMRGNAPYADFPVASLAKDNARLSFTAPAVQAVWGMRWQKSDGTVLADAPLRVTTNADAPHLEMTTDSDSINGQSAPQVTINAVTSTGKPAALIGGHVTVTWQETDPANLGWKDYHFGTQNFASGAPMPVPAGDFLTDWQGAAQLRLSLPKPPTEPGLYQAAITTQAESDQGVADAPTIILPLHNENTAIGIRPLSPNARFAQNGIARFAVIGLSSEGKAREVSGLSYQIYEEGRDFDWYQDDGRWNYKREAQLRPIGGGPLSIRPEGSTVLEWPVTAGNYRLEILDQSGKRVAQSNFSAGWDSVNATTPSLPLTVTLPKTLELGHEAAARFTLPAPAMVTAIIADAHIRKTIHEMRPKGENILPFTPAEGWQNGVSVTVDATAATIEGAISHYHGATQAALAHSVKPVLNMATGIGIIADNAPTLHIGDSTTISFGIINRGNEKETFSYALTAAPGLKIINEEKGSLTLNGRESRSLSVSISGDQIGAKDLKLEVTGTHAPRAAYNWQIAIVPPATFPHSLEATAAMPQQILIAPATKSHTPDIQTAYIARHPMTGLPEILAYVAGAHPFTTQELALGIDTLRLWGDVVTASGMLPDFAVAARRQSWMMRLLRHQNPDGGFAAMRGGDSTMDDTAAALIAFGADNSDAVRPARELAVGWLKQKLSNTWFDEKERTSRAAAYAGLAAVDAIDPASLHYFSDTSATSALSSVAEANMAAAFKHMHDPNAAAFWIKKMLDENGRSADIALLNALAATDALSSDDVHAAMRTMAENLHRGIAPTFINAAELLRALAANNVNAGKWRLLKDNQAHDVAGVYAVPLSDDTSSLRNGDTQPVATTIAVKEKMPHFALPEGTEIARHIYRLNGVELSPQTKPAHGEVYIVELSGKIQSSTGTQILLHDSAEGALHPIGCALSAKLDSIAFMPWFTPHDLSPVAACEMFPYGLNTVLAPMESDNVKFRAVYFAHLDAKAVGDLPPPQIRILQ